MRAMDASSALAPRRRAIGTRGATRAKTSRAIARGAVRVAAGAVSQEYAMDERGVLMPTGKYCVNHAETVRRKTRTVTWAT